MDKKADFIVRKYRQNDYDEIIDIWLATGMGDSKRNDDKKTIQNTIDIGGCLLILEDINKARICGTSWMTFDGRRIHLHHFAILPEYQGKGLSKILLAESLKFVKNKGCQVKLEVHRTNEKAINLYKKEGFQYLGDYDVYIIRNIYNSSGI
ncbi:MAG: GNAT family N-acetyltransferase [Bacteroidales bacterium]|jgi:ribosomal protein S18 acetylase RimI-like enzyme|nr:GNAT family N-acetyltransferase [Bacteroidales bacterium]